MTKKTLQEVREATFQVLKTHPDGGHTSPARYADVVSGEPICLVGQVGALLGLPIVKWENGQLETDPEYFEEFFDDEAYAYLCTAQNEADRMANAGRVNHQWQKAFMAAESTVPADVHKNGPALP